MWSTEPRLFNLRGTVSAGSTALAGVLVDVYRCWRGTDGGWKFEQLNAVAAATAQFTNQFEFIGLQVPVLVQQAVVSTEPYPTIPVIRPSSFPTLVFRITRQLVDGGAARFEEVYDERQHVDEVLKDNPDRINIVIPGDITRTVILPDGNPQVIAVAGVSVSAPASLQTGEFRFGRVGRIIRGDIGDLQSTRPGYADPSVDGLRDSPFGGHLQIGGFFGADFTVGGDQVFYTLSYSPYSGNPAAPFDPARERFIDDPLVNTKYVVGENRWVALPLGPLDDTYNDAPIRVYKLSPAPAAGEYWPFPDLIASWNAWKAPNDLLILKLTAYVRKQGKPLQKCAMPDAFLPLRIDNRRIVISLAEWQTGMADLAAGTLSGMALMDTCSVVGIRSHVAGATSNECIGLRYSLEDGLGNAHPHVADYAIEVAYTPRQEGNVPLEANVPLAPFLGNGTYNPCSDSYLQHLSTGPLFEVRKFTSVLVPKDAWPSQRSGCCGLHAAEVRMTCRLRTTDGWGPLFGCAILGRHLILKAA